MKSPLILSVLLTAGVSAMAADSGVSVKVLAVTGVAPKVGEKTLEKGTALKAQDVVLTGEGTTVELMVCMGAADGPGTLVRVTPNSKMTVLSLTQITHDDETLMDFEVAATKSVTTPSSLAAVVSE